MIGELHHLGRKRRQGPRGRAARASSRSPTRPIGWCRATPAACAGASTWRRRWWPGPRCCSSTSRPPASTRGPAPSCGPCSTLLVAPGRHDPAHHPVPGGGRAARRRHRRGRPRARDRPGRLARSLKRQVGGEHCSRGRRRRGRPRCGGGASSARIAGASPTIDSGARSVIAPTTGGVGRPGEVADALADAEIAVEDLGLRQPTLDECSSRSPGRPTSRTAHRRGGTDDRRPNVPPARSTPTSAACPRRRGWSPGAACCTCGASPRR